MAALVALLVIWAPTLARADEGMERQFTDLVHRERARAAVPAYGEKADLADVARGQAQRMAREKRLYHNPRLGDEVRDWEAVGENVGRGPTVESIHDAFMASSTHRAEILSTDFTEVGIGVAVADDGEIWVAQVFRKPSTAPAPSPAPTTTAPPPRPAPTSAAPSPFTTSASTTSTSTTSTTSTTVALPAPPPPAPPQVLAATAPASPPAPPEPAAAPAPTRQIGVSVPLSSQRSTADDVTVPIRIAATMLVLVVAAQTTFVARVQFSSAEARRQRSHASMNSSTSPSSTPWTLPVS